MVDDVFKARAQARVDLADLAERYINLHQASELEGLAALGEDLLKLADCTEGRTSWLSLLTRLQRLSG